MEHGVGQHYTVTAVRNIDVPCRLIHVLQDAQLTCGTYEGTKLILVITTSTLTKKLTTRLK